MLVALVIMGPHVEIYKFVIMGLVSWNLTEWDSLQKLWKWHYDLHLFNQLQITLQKFSVSVVSFSHVLNNPVQIARDFCVDSWDTQSSTAICAERSYSCHVPVTKWTLKVFRHQWPTWTNRKCFIFLNLEVTLSYLNHQRWVLWRKIANLDTRWRDKYTTWEQRIIFKRYFYRRWSFDLRTCCNFRYLLNF